MLRCPLFPGDNEFDQLVKIFTILGSPTENNWKDFKLLKNAKIFRQRNPYPLNKLFPSATNDAIGLFKLFMVFDPNKRISCTNALKHKYFDKNTKPKMTPISQLPRLDDL